MDAGGVFSSTLRALLEARRLLPILLVCIPLVVAQGTFSHDLLAVPLAIAMCLAFVLLAPFAYRFLFLGADAPARPLGVVVYFALAVVAVGLLGIVFPMLLGMGLTFLTSRTSMGVSFALFLVGGWGLARDVELEARLTSARARASAMEREAERAQLHSLRANLDPHFLFNTLNAIAEWCREDGAVAERAILKLSAMLRAVLDGVQTQTWSLERELELARALFELYRVRSPSAFSLTWEVDDRAKGVPIPPLLLLPLAENAMKHGPSAGNSGDVSFRVGVGANVLDIVIENPGANGGPRPGSTGLPTTERRLALAYGDAAHLSIRSVESHRTQVSLTLPLAGPRADIIV
jgi:hypothetical protein